MVQAGATLIQSTSESRCVRCCIRAGGARCGACGTPRGCVGACGAGSRDALGASGRPTRPPRWRGPAARARSLRQGRVAAPMTAAAVARRAREGAQGGVRFSSRQRLRSVRVRAAACLCRGCAGLQSGWAAAAAPEIPRVDGWSIDEPWAAGGTRRRTRQGQGARTSAGSEIVSACGRDRGWPWALWAHRTGTTSGRRDGQRASEAAMRRWRRGLDEHGAAA